MVKLPPKIRRVLQAVIFALLITVVYAFIMYFYPRLIFNHEWKDEQEVFETKCVEAQVEQTRVSSAVTRVQKIGTKYNLATDEIRNVLEEFLNGTQLLSTAFKFNWIKRSCNFRMLGNSFMIYDEASLKFYNVGPKVIIVFFRSIFPIYATFAMGCGASAINTIFYTMLKLCFKVEKYPAMTKERNRLTKVRDSILLVISIFYFLFCFFSGSYCISKFADCTFADGMKKCLQFMTSLYPTLKYPSTMMSTYSIAVFYLHVNTGMTFMFFSIMRFSRTAKFCGFDIPVMSHIADAHETDKIVQKKLKLKRKNMVEGKLIE